MAFPLQRFKGSSGAPAGRLTWLALVLFFVGGAICSFNPPADDGQHIKGEHVMNTQSESRANEGTDLKGGGGQSEIETATFALG